MEDCSCLCLCLCLASYAVSSWGRCLASDANTTYAITRIEISNSLLSYRVISSSSSSRLFPLRFTLTSYRPRDARYPRSRSRLSKFLSDASRDRDAQPRFLVSIERDLLSVATIETSRSVGKFSTSGDKEGMGRGEGRYRRREKERERERRMGFHVVVRYRDLIRDGSMSTNKTRESVYLSIYPSK